MSGSIDSSFASSVDTASRFATADQERWLGFSTEVIDGLARDFLDVQEGKEELSFGDLLFKLGNKRQEIAQELGHGEDPARRRDYGQLRSETFMAYEVFVENKPDAVWARMAPNVFAQVDAMIQTISEKGQTSEEDETTRQYVAEDESWAGVITSEGMEIYIQAPKSDEKSYSTELAKIELSATDPREIVIKYASVNKYNQRGDFAIAKGYLQEMLAIKQDDYATTDAYIEAFLVSAGKFTHLMAHILPFRLGTAAITEWLVRAAAHSKGINLGQFNLSQGLSWDFKALLTPNRDTYVIWFAKHAFVEPKPTDPSSSFTFKTSVGYGM